MKILVFCWQNIFLQNTASANRLRSLIEPLGDSGLEVQICIYGGYSSSEEKRTMGISGRVKGIDYVYLNLMTIQGFWKKRFIGYLGDVFIVDCLVRRITNYFNVGKNILWFDSSLVSFRVAVKLKKRNISNLKLFLEMSEYLDIHEYNISNFFQRWKARITKIFFEKKAFYCFDGIALMTVALFNHYLRFIPPQPRLLHLPMTVDLDRFKKNSEPLQYFKKPYIAFVGIMNNAKDGVDILINAFSKIQHTIPEHTLYLVGPKHYDTPGHLELIKRLSLENRVIWTGEYSRDQIPAIIDNADLLVLPRPDSKQARGGFPTKLGEYLATGKPVCATSVGEIPNYLKNGESVYFAEPGSIDSFAEAMSRALNNYDEAKKVGVLGRKIAGQYFNKTHQSGLLLEFFEKMYDGVSTTC
ncbi:MAG: glycosyltransferase [Ignavibacteriales bacterium]|nr:MAG: glycosyltransferase [Ignavibacteriales bacterium]